MTVFEIVFGLVAVILGLALTQMAGNLHRLALAGRRVRWAPEPLLLAAMIVLVISNVWLDQWREHDLRTITTGLLLLQVLKMMAIYFAAASALPEFERGDERIDLVDYYYRTRGLSYGALIVGLCLFYTYGWIAYPRPFTLSGLAGFLLFPGLYATLIVLRWRAYHIVLMAAGVAFFGSQIFFQRIGS